jgi:glyoxylase-like metal-dependent hydrolase (beta-lactamase superfamily II)
MRHRPLVSNPGSAEHSAHVPPTEHPLLPSCNGAPTTGSMIVQVLGCSGSIAAGCRTTSFLLDDDVLIDAGTGVGDMPLDALSRVEHILISHSHLDHILAIGLLADSVMRERSAAGRGPIQVHALPETIAALRTHIFNGVIWPDFTRLPSADKPMLALVPLAVGDVLELNGKRVEVLEAVTPCRRSATPSTAARRDGGSSPATPARTRRSGSVCRGCVSPIW